MREVVRILCGSHLYGANLPSSDKDYKVVYIPSSRDILLGRGSNYYTKENGCDVEYMTLQQYLKLLCQGQTSALDMFFAPEKFHKGPPEPEWRAIQLHGERFLSRNCKAFVGYCRQQAGKYVVKMDRYQALCKIVEYLEGISDTGIRLAGLRLIDPCLDQLVAADPHMEWVTHTSPHGKEIEHLSVCQTEMPVTAAIRSVLDTYVAKMQRYGQRVRKAKALSEDDWKSMYHAVRVGQEALELMETGKITFPRPEEDLLLSIRQGEEPFEDVGELIESNLTCVQEAAAKSSLPEEPDWDLAERLVIAFYRSSVIS